MPSDRFPEGEKRPYVWTEDEPRSNIEDTIGLPGDAQDSIGDRGVPPEPGDAAMSDEVALAEMADAAGHVLEPRLLDAWEREP